MNNQSVTGFLAIIALCCAGLAIAPAHADPNVSSQADVDNDETILLVSLDDGTIVMQRIRSSADICFKKNSDSATTCLTQGAPVIDPASNAVIGYEMIEDQIQLVAKSD